MNSEKMSQNAVALHTDRISHSQPPMPNASFLSLAGLMAAAGRNMGQGNPFLGNPQTSLASVPNSVPNASVSEAGGGGVPVTSMGGHMNSFGNGAPGLGNTIISPATSMGMDQDPPSSSASITPGITSIQPQHPRTPFPGLLNNTDWSWEFSQEGANALLERGRSRNWTYEETLELISLYTSDEWQGKFGSEKKNHRAIWAALAGALKRRKDVSGDEARQRLNNLKALYNRTRRQLLSGEISSPQWEYWDPLHAFLGRPQPFLPLPPASPLPQFPPQSFHQSFQGPQPNHHNFNRIPEMGVPHPQLPNMNPHNSGNAHHHHHNHHALLGALGLGPPFGGFHGNGNSFHKNDKTVSGNPGDPNKENEGDERKQEMGSFPGPSEASVGSGGDNPGASDDISIPLSPEQFMSEENEPIAGGGGGGGASCSGPSPASNPPRPESYKLRHNNHLTLVLESLAGDESFMDVTLTAQGKAIKAHKSVLSAVSPYFRSVLKSNPCQHPIIIMPRDIRFEELNSIISYIYRGEMTVAASDLSSLLKTAEILQVTGLSPSETTSGASGIMSQVHGFPAANRVPNFNTNVSHSFSKRNSQKQNQESIQHQQQDQDLQQQQQQLQQQQQMEQDNVDDDDDETLNEDTNDSQGRIDPLDFLNTNMACVKEEVRSDDEAGRDDNDDDGEQNLPANTSYSSPTHNEKESESVSPNIQNQLASGSIQNQLASGSIQNPLSSGSPNPFEDITSKPFNPGETEGTSSSDNLQESQQSLTPFGCPYCFEIHRPFEMLQSHLRLKHPTKPSFPCGCGRVFFRMSTFADHSKKCKF